MYKYRNEVDLNDADDGRGHFGTEIAAGRFEYVFQVEYDHVDAGHLLKKHTADTDGQRLSVHVFFQNLACREPVVLFFFHKLLRVGKRKKKKLIKNERYQ